MQEAAIIPEEEEQPVIPDPIEPTHESIDLPIHTSANNQKQAPPVGQGYNFGEH